MGLGGRGARYDRYLVDDGVSEEAAGHNYRVHHRETYLQSMYTGREDGGIQKVTQVVVPRTQPHKGGEVGRAKDK